MTDYKTDDVWLMQGDCLERMKEIPSDSVDAVICDPPYGTVACAWDNIIPFEPMWEQLKRIVKPNGAIVLFGSQPFTTSLISSNIRNFKYLWVWNKRFAANFSLAKYQPLKIHEDICVFGYGTANYFPQKTQRDVPIKLGKNSSKKGSSNLHNAKSEYDGKVYTDKNPESIVFFDTRAEGQIKKHPTQKPVALMEYLIKTYTNEGETVLDFTAGSFTTGVAAVNTNRKFIGIELDNDYFDIGVNRIKERIKCLDLKIELEISMED